MAKAIAQLHDSNKQTVGGQDGLLQAYMDVLVACLRFEHAGVPNSRRNN